MVRELARRIVVVAGRSSPAPAEPEDLAQLDNAFGAPEQGARARSVSVVVVVGSPRRRDWNPYIPDASVGIADYVSSLVLAEGARARISWFDDAPAHELSGDTLCLVLVDPSALLDPGRRERLRAFIESSGPQTRVFLLQNGLGQPPAEQALALEAAVSETFPVTPVRLPTRNALSEAVASALTEAQSMPQLTLRERLTKRELEIVGLVATGRSSKQIAAELYISRRTVETHLARIYRKLGVRSRAGLAALERSHDQAGHQET